MNRYYYDLHIHSCLSPCADNDNTPYNIAGMAALLGINIIALTDHNSCLNLPAFFKAAKAYGIIPVAGMELTTAEEVHLVCLFEELEKAMEFGREIDSYRVKIKNKTDIFGEQLILGEEDKLIGSEEFLLPNATTVTIEKAPEIVAKYGGICYPAHIDRQSNGILAMLGFMPERPVFNCVEINNSANVEELTAKHNLQNKKIIISSDAHCLTDIKEKQNYIELDDEPYSSALVRHQLFRYLKGEI